VNYISEAKVGIALLESRQKSKKPKHTWTTRDGKVWKATDEDYQEVREKVLLHSKKLDIKAKEELELKKDSK